MDGAANATAGPRFLIVDDKAFIRSVVRSMLERLAAAEVIEAPSGAAAREVLREGGPRRGPAIDCVVCDWNMAPINGLGLLRQIRAGEIPGVSRSLCFIMLTGHATEKVVKAAIDLDVNAYLVKPVSFEKLVGTVDQALAQRLVLRAQEHYESVDTGAVPDTFRTRETVPLPWMAMRPSRGPRFEEQILDLQRAVQGRAAASISNSRRAPVSAIQPGQILAEDIFAAADLLVAPAGTVITPALLAQFKAFAADAGEDAHLWVGDSEPVHGPALND